jgi:hypothetical protein
MSSTNSDIDNGAAETAFEEDDDSDLAVSGTWLGPVERNRAAVGDEHSDLISAGAFGASPKSTNIDAETLIAASIGALCVGFVIGRLVR